MKKITLYYAPDNASLIVRIVLEESNLPYEAVLVDRRRNEQQSAQFLRLNPAGLIPVCVIDGVVITETAAIALTLCESAGSPLVPAVDNPLRAVFLRWLFFLSNNLHADLRQLFYAEKYVGPDSQQQAGFRESIRARISEHLKILEAQYRTSGGPYLLAPHPSVIDIYLTICLRWLQLYPLADRGWFSLADYPALLSLTEAMQLRDAVIRACEAEGIRGKFLSDAVDAVPVEGSAL